MPMRGVSRPQITSPLSYGRPTLGARWSVRMISSIGFADRAATMERSERKASSEEIVYGWRLVPGA
jgi:hypothetical protein